MVRIPRPAEILAELDRRSYLHWYNRVSPRYPAPRHIEWLIEHYVERVIAGECKRLIISMPPQHVKSDAVTRKLPVYWGLKHPGENVLITGYNDRFATKMLSEPARNLADECGLLSSDATALDSWRLTTGGTVSVRGVGSPPTGIPRLNLIIIDDPIKSREEAMSETIRENLWEWYTGSIVQRFWPDTRVIIIMTRWHEDDLVGRIIASGDESWEIVNLPAIAEEDDVLGREEGDALWPEYKPLLFLLEQKKAMGDAVFEALFQGNPTPPEGDMFKVAKIGWVDAPPSGPSYIAFDLGASTKGDYTYLCQTWPLEGGRFVQDFAFCRAEPHERNQWMRQQVELRKPRRVRGPQDPGAGGKEAAQNFIRLMVGFNVHVEPVSGSKELRAEPYAAQLNAGMFSFVRSEGSIAAREQLRQFPRGKHDDAVDAGADSFLDAAHGRTFAGSMPVAPARR